MKKVITAVSAILIIGFFAASVYAWACGITDHNHNFAGCW